MNIDGINIATSYIRNESLRNGVIARMEAITANYESRTADLDSLEAAAGRTALADAIRESRAQIDFIASAGFPIGWSYFPHVYLNGDPVPAPMDRNTFGGWLLWVLGIALTAVLAGLGAPFWYDAVTGIARTAQRARSGK